MGSVYLNIPNIRRVVTIWNELLCKIIVYVYGLVSRKKVFSESIHCIETHIDVVVEVLKVQSTVSFELCLDKEFIESCSADLLFQSPHATNFCILSTVQWWTSLVIWDHSGRIRRFWKILLGW